jgi:hypothetical protein
MLLDHCPSPSKRLTAHTVVSRKLDLRIQPELGLTVGATYMDMKPRFLPREEEESK